MRISNRLPLWYWLVALAMLAWNGMGVMAYIAQTTMTPEALAALPEAERAVYANMPAWVTAAFAFAVFGGAGGCLLLLLRSGWAVPVLVLSLLGVIAQMSYVVVISKGYEVYGPGGMVMPAMVLTGALFLVWFSRLARRRGWLR
jgi:hypothetical protein